MASRSRTKAPPRSTSRKTAKKKAKKARPATRARPPRPLDQATAYARDVVKGRTIAGRLVRLACERHLRDLKEGPKRGLKWDRELAEFTIGFFPDVLRLVGGESEGHPFVLSPWQAFIIGSLFGWVRADGFRRYRTAYIETAKGNGKSPLAAGIGIKMFVADKEPRAEVYAAATSKSQAMILFRDAVAMVDQSPELTERLRKSGVGDQTWNLAHLASGSFFRPIASEGRTGRSGPRPHCSLVDELHEHATGDIVTMMRAGQKGRRQPLNVEITNSGHDRHSICWKHHEYSEKVLQGVLQDDTWFAFMSGLDPCPAHQAEGRLFPEDGCPNCDDWRNPTAWPKANPNLGVSIKEEYLASQVREAEGMPGIQNEVKRLNFCIWTEALARWVDQAVWAEGGAPIDIASLAGRICFIGLDLSSTTDLTAAIVVFPPAESDGEWVVLPYFFVPEEGARQRSARDRVPYLQWIREGHLHATPGNVVDYRFIRATLQDLAERFNVQELVYDRWNSSQLITELQDDGFTCVPFGQGFASMAAPCREFEKLVKGRSIRHGGHPVLSWCLSNTMVRKDPAGNLKPDKEKSTERIDGIVGLLMGLGRGILEESGASPYEEEGSVFAV